MKENTTAIPRVFSRGPISLRPLPPRHLIPSIKIRGGGAEQEGGERSEVRGKLCRTSRTGAGWGAAALKRGHVDCRLGEDRVRREVGKRGIARPFGFENKD